MNEFHFKYLYHQHQVRGASFGCYKSWNLIESKTQQDVIVNDDENNNK